MMESKISGEECYKQAWDDVTKAYEQNIPVICKVRIIVDYGLFVDLSNGLSGFIHITDMRWKRVRHPSEIYSVGDRVIAKILKIDSVKSRVLLGVKQLFPDPWKNPELENMVETKKQGKVTAIVDYGFFVELENLSIEALVHVSEIDWNNKNVNPKDVVKLNQEIEVYILEVDLESRKISAGLKQCYPNPWKQFETEYPAGSKIIGEVFSLTDFGAFVKLPFGIDGLIKRNNSESYNSLTRGTEISVIVEEADSERERIYLKYEG